METRGSRRKRMRLQQQATIGPKDRISKLPVDLVHDIISLLPARTAGRMIVLSKTWKYFCEALRCINFEVTEFQDVRGKILYGKIDQFMTKYLSVINPLALWRVKISAHTLFRSRFINHIEKCFDLANQGKIQELDLHFWRMHGVRCVRFMLPIRYFQSELQLTILKLEGCRIAGLHFLGFPVMKILTLKDFHISSDSLSNMICGCPKLESLIIESVDGLGRATIINHSLRIIVVKHCVYPHSFYMDVPLLHTFEYNGLFASKNRVSRISLPFRFETPEDVILGNMKVLYLSYALLSNTELTHLFGVVPNVNDVKLNHCTMFYENEAVSGNMNEFTIVDVHIPQLVERWESSMEFLYRYDTKIFFRCNNLVPSESVGFSRLTSFTYGGSLLSDEALDHLISLCPVLENLNLQSCFRLRNLKIVSRVLKTLTFQANDHLEGEIKAIEIVAPHLLSFVYEGPLIKFPRIIASEKLHCYLLFRTLGGNGPDLQLFQLRDILEKFKEASNLTLTSGSIEILLMTDGERLGHSWYNWAHFKLRVNRSNMYYLHALSLLNSSGCCTTYSIELRSSCIQLTFEDLTQVEKLNLHLGPVHDCIRDHLVEAKFNDFDANIHVMSLVEHLLLKAENLHALVLHIKSGINSVSLMETFKKIPYISRKCQICIKTAP